MCSHRAAEASVLCLVREKDRARERECKGSGCHDCGNEGARQRVLSAGGSQRRNIWVGNAQYHEHKLEG